MKPGLLDQIEKLDAAQGRLVTPGNEIINIIDIIYFYIDAGTVHAYTENQAVYLLEEGLAELQNQLKGTFIRTHRSFLVKISKIKGLSRRYPAETLKGPALDLLDYKARDECMLHLVGVDRQIPVTGTFARGVKKALGIRTFRHLVPDHPWDKRLRNFGIKDFGWRDLEELATADTQAVETFKAKWDIKLFDRPTMLKYFRQVGIKEIDKRKVIKNIIWQLYRWIDKGIEEPEHGNIRSLWYRIKAVLSYHSDVLDPGDVDIFYDVLTQLVEDERLFKYRDFGFMDVNEPYRGIGKTNPEIILASEKVGHYYFIKTLAEEVGASFICLKGEPAHISIEYFSEELREVTGTKPKSVFVSSDIDPAGFSIQANLVKGLERQGHEIKSVVPLVTLSIFEDEEIALIRYPVVNYEKQGGDLVPIPPANQGQLTKGLDWYKNDIDDDRLFSIRTIGDKKVYTIWGIESDAASRTKIRKRFLENLPDGPRA
jgi:hypothetical protein